MDFTTVQPACKVNGCEVISEFLAASNQNQPGAPDVRSAILGTKPWTLQGDQTGFYAGNGSLTYIFCFRDTTEKLERDLPNIIQNTSNSGIKSNWTTLYSTNNSTMWINAPLTRFPDDWRTRRRLRWGRSTLCWPSPG